MVGCALLISETLSVIIFFGRSWVVELLDDALQSLFSIFFLDGVCELRLLLFLLGGVLGGLGGGIGVVGRRPKFNHEVFDFLFKSREFDAGIRSLVEVHAS